MNKTGGIQMDLEGTSLMERPALKHLSKEEIDRRIEKVITQVIAGAEEDADDPTRPRWITAAELVRRMRPFLVYN